MVQTMLAPLVMMAATAGTAAATAGTATAPDGVKIHYETTGTGRPALVLVHCWTCDSGFWKDQVERFGRGRQVVTLDLAGHGRSGRGRKSYRMQAFGQDVKAVADALKLDRMVLVGHSMGGAVILEAARLLGNRVVGLVPVDSLHDVEQRDDPNFTRAFLAKMQADFEGTVTGFAREYWFVPTTPPAVVDRVIKAATSFPREIAIPALRETWSYDAARGFDAVKVPIVAVNADRFPTNVAANRKHSFRFDVVIMKGVGHYPMLEDPPRFGEHLEEALGRVRKR